MNLSKSLRNEKYVLGIDNSTRSTAYSIIHKGDVITYGEIVYPGINALDRLVHIKKKMEDFTENNQFSSVYMESTVNVRSTQTAIKMAYSAGVVMSCLMEKAALYLVSPLTWQSYIGNKSLTTLEKKRIKDRNPGKSKSWYTSENRRVRKQRTMTWVKDKFNIDCDNDNISDAIALSFYGYEKGM